MDDDIEAQFARMGAVIAGKPAEQPATEVFEVLPPNADAIDAWLACQTQWRIAAGMGGIAYLGLDYGAVDVVLRRMRFADPDAVLADLLVMEGAALKVLGETEK
ncbi:DUF1799 domain-containing protein [Paracoccus denitrificans]|uniref:DUF1799 domain-containing protein n=1 Tax=Paracoccus denitrificans TaxID=266 RepID=UPI003364C59E